MKSLEKSISEVKSSGRVWIEAGGDVTAGSSVFVNPKTGALLGVESPEVTKLKNACFLQSGKTGDHAA
jgi:hypothetical protein